MDLTSLSKTILGLDLNHEKGALLLPPDAPAPSSTVLTFFNPRFSFKRDGVVIAGAPVGTPAFISSFVTSKVDEAIVKVRCILGVGKQSPRAAHRLLSATKLLCYLAATVPPEFTLDPLQSFDTFVQQSFLDVVGGTGVCSDSRRQRAFLRLTLPAPVGCSLFCVSDQARIAWWSSVSSCLSLDPLLFSLRHGLTAFAPRAFSAIGDMFGGFETHAWSAAKSLFPASASGLCDGSFYAPGLTPPAKKIGKVCLRALGKRKMDAWKNLVSPVNVGDSLTQSDSIIALGRSDFGRLFTQSLKLSFKGVFFADDNYKAFVRYFLGLPPLTTLFNQVNSPAFDYPVQRCLSVHGVNGTPFLDAAGDHANSNCPSTYLARARKHLNLIRVLVVAGQEAGLHARSEPDSHSLLLGEFSKQECRRLFPKFPSAEYKEQFGALVNIFDNEDLTPEVKRLAIQKLAESFPPINPKDSTGLRLDIAFENPFTGESKWVDVSVVHTTAASYVSKEFKHTSRRFASASATMDKSFSELLLSDPSPTLMDRAYSKSEKYARLVLVAKKQVLEKKRSTCPAFTPFLLSDAGELSPSALDLVGWLVQCYRDKALSTPRSDGLSLAECVKLFKHRLQANLMVALANGIGAVLSSAGQPFG